MANAEMLKWRDLIDISIKRSKKVRGGNYVQLATVDLDGNPKCRTVVFRGFSKLHEKEYLRMITDGRSEKIAHIKNNPKCEMVWWFQKSSEQYRISGQLRLIGSDEEDREAIIARKQQWGNLSDRAREQMFWNHPGVPYEGEPEVPVAGRDSEGKVLEPPDSFLLMLLEPETVKYLRLTDNYAQTDMLENGAWNITRVNP